MTVYKKLDEKTLEVTEPVQKVEKKSKFTRKFLKHQKQAITEDKEKYVAARDAEIEYINTLLLEMDKLSIIEEKEDEPQ